ncbi:class I tRNA ligase family protein [Micromonospora sp. BRA006-A]|nr:class I tRNA ligase family protein [Micromonospora sp. BRA006-A]
MDLPRGRQRVLLRAAHPALHLAAGLPDRPTGLVVNEFYRLTGAKFSTSREHAIWAHEFLATEDPAVVQAFLSWDRPDSYESDFRPEAYEAFAARYAATVAGTTAGLDGVLADTELTRGEQALRPEHFDPATAVRAALAAYPVRRSGRPACSASSAARNRRVRMGEPCVLVVGAGISGVLLARRLRDAGADAVLIGPHDGGPDGRPADATAASGGLVRAFEPDPAARSSPPRASPNCWPIRPSRQRPGGGGPARSTCSTPGRRPAWTAPRCSPGRGHRPVRFRRTPGRHGGDLGGPGRLPGPGPAAPGRPAWPRPDRDHTGGPPRRPRGRAARRPPAHRRPRRRGRRGLDPAPAARRRAAGLAAHQAHPVRPPRHRPRRAAVLRGRDQRPLRPAGRSRAGAARTAQRQVGRRPAVPRAGRRAGGTGPDRGGSAAARPGPATGRTAGERRRLLQRARRPGPAPRVRRGAHLHRRQRQRRQDRPGRQPARRHRPAEHPNRDPCPHGQTEED